MKKSIVIVIGIIYIASICFIGFFGMKIKAYNETIYVTSIECINTEAEEMFDGEGTLIKYILLNYTTGLKYQIEYRVYPDNATNQTVEFEHIGSSSIATVSQSGEVSFFGAGIIYVQIKSTDGKNIVEKVMLNAQN
ncbi:MAG: hypothetical protein PHQ62_01010 [Clostridia bacterium]|nr:hypothetical protein [Clostridia bacterium]